MDNLANQLDILCCTCENANDANYLLHVLKGKNLLGKIFVFHQ